MESENTEIWIDVIGYDGIFEVSNFGRIKSLERYCKGKMGLRKVKEKILRQQERKRLVGVGLCIEGVTNNHYTHNLVYMSFNKDSPLKPNEVIAHLDKDIWNNNLANLAIKTCKESTALNMSVGKMSKEKLISNLKGRSLK